MRTPTPKLFRLRFFIVLVLFTHLFAFTSCSNENESDMTDEMAQEDSDTANEDTTNDENDTDGDGTDQTDDCPDTVGFLFEESNGIVSIEFENNEFPDGWVSKNGNGSSNGYMQWEGNPSMGNPGNGKVVFPVRITSTGTYRFIWYSSYQKGNNGTEHNDSWLRFPDADDFFGRKNNGDIVYPNGSGQTPNPEGTSKDGWFKIYRSGNDNAFKWQASTSDNDAHNVFATFSNEGVYLIEVSARSDFHAIDRLLLFKEELSQNDAIDMADTFSQKVVCE
ncbi:hypothetical protein [uncultured Croceitalea sp.]|uniref:hypothetical protein n=1 Tax=uncultured Croceitalea sp. TaxID=1798908 RepID=UPI003305D88A